MTDTNAITTCRESGAPGPASRQSSLRADGPMLDRCAATPPGSKARNERGALSVSKFKAIGCVAWERDA